MEINVQEVCWVVAQGKTSPSGAKGEAELGHSHQKFTAKPTGRSEAEMILLSLKLERGAETLYSVLVVAERSWEGLRPGPGTPFSSQFQNKPGLEDSLWQLPQLPGDQVP